MRAPITSPIRRVRPASIPQAPLRPGDNLRGAMLMCVSVTGFTCNDVVMKFVTQDMPLYQAITLRGLVMILGIWLVALRDGGLKLHIAPGARFAMVLRVAGEVGTTLLFLNALMHMAIGDLTAIMQSLPLVVTVAAALVFGERLGWRRVSAVVIGMLGVLIILRPGSGAFGIWSLVAIGAMLMMALRDLATRNFGAHISSSTIAFHTAVVVMLTGLFLSLRQGWVMPDLAQLLLLALAGGFLTVGYVTAVSAMRVGEISYVAPFRYVSLLVAILAGLVVFGEWPDIWTWAGSALVVGAGVYMVLREARLMRYS